MPTESPDTCSAVPDMPAPKAKDDGKQKKVKKTKAEIRAEQEKLVLCGGVMVVMILHVG